MAWYSTDTDCDRRLKDENARLRSEIAEQRYEAERQREQQERNRREAQSERKQEYEERLQYATSFPEAFNKARILFGREAASERRDNAQAIAHIGARPEEKDDPCWQQQNYFSVIYEQLPQAEAVYAAEMQAVQEQIDALKASALTRIADRLQSAGMSNTLIEAFRQNKPDHLTNW